ncbi:hypothetical protein K466DRAFT_590385 [Polyporus arcularius HHB13444]|uniref:Uncharacterized protein n=1 Tax=Polyporus arcularius HHB13444 TaxID=1314778 RepID=A0A5C3NYV9_9APHY|nr:hypothetical protein K466DRAFT_590385 [Polyporus arcularius HHB13444]
MSSRQHVHIAVKLVRKVRQFASRSVGDALHFLRPERAAHITRRDYLPLVPAGLKETSRWLQVTILNRTHFRLQYIDTYFSSGEYYDRPTDVAPLSEMTYSCFSNEFMTGCAGGTRFRIHLDDGSGTFRDFAIGWVGPPIGHYKAGAVFDRSPRVACEWASASGESMLSQRGKDGDGGLGAFTLRVTTEPGSQAVYLVEEVLVL